MDIFELNAELWKKYATAWPSCYLHVTSCREGLEWVCPLRGNASINLEHQVTRWVREYFGGDARLDRGIMPKIEGDYYAEIKTDGRPPESVVSWVSGGFYVKLEDY